VGPWTTSGTAAGAPLEPGRRRTPDELNFDVVGLARILGRRLDGRAELQVRLWQNELRPTHTRLVGVHTLADPENSELLRQSAQEAFAWLSALAPAGYEFVLTDAVRLQPKLDLTAEVVAVDAVVQATGTPATRCATGPGRTRPPTRRLPRCVPRASSSPISSGPAATKTSPTPNPAGPRSRSSSPPLVDLPDSQPRSILRPPRRPLRSERADIEHPPATTPRPTRLARAQSGPPPTRHGHFVHASATTPRRTWLMGAQSGSSGVGVAPCGAAAANRVGGRLAGGQVQVATK
jgi:hypothetical protein